MPHTFISLRNASRSPGKTVKLFLKLFLVLASLSIIGAIGIFAYIAKDLPSPGKINKRFIAESTKIYDRTGNHLLYDIHSEEKRTIIPFGEMPESIRYAAISIEDQDFYSHSGIQFKAIFRAIFKDIINFGAAQGGSTITQQLIKNSLLSSERTFTRKAKEVILAIELEQKFSKDEILEMYLNEIPYGSNAYGVEAASQTFFGKHAKELTLDEATLLASLPKAPTYYSPFGSHPEELKARQEYTLRRMFEQGYITEEQFKQASEINILARVLPNKEKIEAPHFVMYVKEYLETKYGQQTVEEGGLKVYTTLDWDKQKLAEQAVREGAELNAKKYNASNAALVAIDPPTGQILSMVGSKDYFDKSIDGQVNVSIRNRQPGSSFKPYVYLTAFKKGYTPETILWDVDTNFSTDPDKEYAPKNYDGKNRGPVKMKEALAMSLNVPAVKTLYLAGVKDSINTAKSMGITTLNDPNRLGLSLVLGGGEVKLLDHVSAYATLATGGLYHKKSAILKITDNNGEILEEYKGTIGERVIDKKYITMLDSIMSNNSLRAPVFGNNNPLRFDDRPVAAKTGTTNEWRDGWTIGYTPTLAVGVWAGNNNNTPMAQGADGVYVAAPIWRNFVEKAIQNQAIEHFPKYEEEKTGKPVLDGELESSEVRICKIPGKKNGYCLASNACPDSLAKKKKFNLSHTILWYVDKDDPRGDYPRHPEDDPQFKNWEKAVINWIGKEKDFSKDELPTQECTSDDFKSSLPRVEITSPEDAEMITQASFVIKAKVNADYGIKEVALYIDGDKMVSMDKDNLEYSYSVPPSKNYSVIKVRVEVTDKNDNAESDEVEIVATKIP